MLLPSVEYPPGADRALLADDALQRRSAPLLRSLMHVGPSALPLLPSFPRLKQASGTAEQSWDVQAVLPGRMALVGPKI